MRVLLTGGGTGGHVYPALAVAEALCSDASWAVRPQDMAWVGSADSIEQRLLAKEGLTFYPISTGALRGTSPWGAVRSLGKLARGYAQARALLAQFRPDAILATGGYVSVPLVIAAWVARCPALIYLPDIQPGLAVKLLSRLVPRVAVSFDSVAAYFPPQKAVVTGYPVRGALYRVDKDAARRALDLPSAEPVLLVLGGSRGAHSLNQAVRGGLEPLLRAAHLVHVSGAEDHAALAALRDALPSGLRLRYHLCSYMYEQMTDALVAADLVVARAGAATLGEFPAAGLPAMLVPYPYAGQHQHVNAEYLASRGAAVIVEDAALGARLVGVATGLLGDRERLRAMGAAARSLAVPAAAHNIASHLIGLVQARH